MTGSVVTRFDPKAEKFVEYPLPSYPNGIARFISVNDKSQVWFTEYYNGMIGVVDTAGDGVKQSTSR
jgi:streptogramin lyase